MLFNPLYYGSLVDSECRIRKEEAHSGITMAISAIVNKMSSQKKRDKFDLEMIIIMFWNKRIVAVVNGIS